MKKYFLILALLIISPIFAKAQFEMIKATEAYSYVKAHSSDIGPKNLILLEGMETPANPGLYLDLSTGTATAWTFLLHSKDTTDHKGYLYTILRSAGEYSAYYQSDSSLDYQQVPKLDTNFVDSDIIGVNSMKNEQFKTFYESNVDSIAGKIMQLMFVPDFGIDTWVVTAYISDNNYISCAYSASTGNVLQCNLVSTAVMNAVQNALKAYPNPASDRIRIEAPFTGNSEIKLYDNFGRIVKSDKLNFDNSSDINVSGLPAGIYMLRVQNGNDIVTKKINIVR